MNMYHSWWFITLLILICVNLIICSLERLPKTLKLINTPMKPAGETVIKTLPVRKELKVKANLKAVKDEFFNSLAASGFHVSESTEGDSAELYSQKGKYSRLGLYIVHLSILLIFTGAIIGARFGFGGFLNLPEGETSDVAYTGGGKTIPLGFTIKCNWYNTDYYRGSDMPQEFQSELVVIEGGREVLKKVIEVNNPLTYKGITFYQSSYGMIPNAAGVFILKVTPVRGTEHVLNVQIGDTFEMPGTGLKGTINGFSPALTRDPTTGNLITYSDKLINPAVLIQFSEAGKQSFTGWILKRYPETGVLPQGHKVEFFDYWGVEYTGLQVSRDPGVWLIYLASIIMSIGLYIAFFMSNKKIWVRISPDVSGGKSFVKISVGGSASKNRLSYEKEVERIIAKATGAIEERSKK
ncbi:MAG: cytochrome c biogenesis protein ResB [Nitrospirae bacterium]|nr:cytochrome c biogenesis protein ResB [Nitrospirota bacterium]